MVVQSGGLVGYMSVLGNRNYPRSSKVLTIPAIFTPAEVT
jgi:hypothetical protein